MLIIAGSSGMYGAAYLAAKAAFRVGVGLVKIITHSKNRELIYTMLPEAMVDSYENENEISGLELEKSIKWADSVLIGPGMGDSDMAKRLVYSAMKLAKSYDKYLVIDADGLNIISNDVLFSEGYLRKVLEILNS